MSGTYHVSALLLNARDMLGVIVGPRDVFGGGGMVWDAFEVVAVVMGVGTPLAV